jgi:hypothetical protein
MLNVLFSVRMPRTYPTVPGFGLWVAHQPFRFPRAGPTVRDNHPSKILRSAARLVTGQDVIDRRGGRPRIGQPQPAQRHFLQPAGGGKPLDFHEERYLVAGVIERMPDKIGDHLLAVNPERPD